ncbi:MAG: histidinol phosphate phosphatase [Proteobacteria bacterium]|nr:histidinol phosphate phosphatase [Pseudomonadota bacterium]
MFVELAQRLVLASGKVITAHFRKPFSVEEKQDLSPVTIADRESEAAIRRILEAERPQDGIVGEEFGVSGEGKEFQWVIDPIDGTRAFASGKPLFGTLIALLQNGVPILGVIDQPILNETWVGAVGQPTRLNGQICKTRTSCGGLSHAIANLGPQAFPFGNAVALDAYRRLSKAVKTTSVGGDCYTYGLVASGHIDVAIEHDLNLYDFAALVPIVEGAGGRMTDWNGNPLNDRSDGHVLALGNPSLLPDMVELLEGAL